MEICPAAFAAMVAQLAGGVETAGLAFRHCCGIVLAEWRDCDWDGIFTGRL